MSTLEEAIVDRNAKFEQVREFINKNSGLAKQGSEEWHRIRQSIIGGSELATLIGKNPFTNVAGLVASKCGLIKYNSNIATRWGNIFEEITRIMAQMIYIPDKDVADEECIYETGSLEGVIPHHRFSPDGLTSMIYRNEQMYRALIILLEFKSPLSSIPSGVIPPYYLPQVKAGLCDIEQCEMGLFINNMYRKCRIDDFGDNSKYNMSFHASDIKKRVVVGPPLAIGIFGFYQTPEQYEKYENMLSYIDIGDENSDDETSDGKKSIYERILTEVIDIGELDENDTKIIFHLVMSKHITIKYFKPNIFISRHNLPDDLYSCAEDIISYKSYDTPYKFVNQFKRKCEESGCNIVGFLPWKLFMSNHIVVEKEPLYIYQFVDKVNDVIKIVQEICALDSEEEKMQCFKKYYGNARI